MLREIAKNGSKKQREIALLSIAVSEQFRGQRGAMTKEYLAVMKPTLVSKKKTRTIYNAQNGSQLPGISVREEGDHATGDLAVDEAYDGSGTTYDLFADIYDRKSIDNQGMHLDSTVHYQQGYDNAFWNGKQMVYGDGDEDLPETQRLFNRFTAALDVIGHELTHGVTQFEANLVYQNQSGALNESISDVFGSLVKQYQRQETSEQADWIIGEGLFTANVNGKGIRSMKEPGTAYNDPVLGKDPQPGHMDDYITTLEDNGGVHINSGIPNRAFYITARELGGYAWEKAGQIWYRTLTEKLSALSNFQNAANHTFTVAGEIYGKGSLEQAAVKTGWAEVGILADETSETNGNGDEDGCLTAVLRAFGIKANAKGN